MNNAHQHALGGLFAKRERWTLSVWGWLLALLLLCLTAYGMARGIYPFLEVNDGGNGELLVVEGWISSRRIDRAAESFRQGHYRQVVVVRNVSEGNKWESGRYTADYVAADLAAQGVPKEMIHVLFCPVVHKDRTYSCAVAVRQWLQQNRTTVTSLDVATMAAHTRRSRLIYDKAFGGNVKVGAIALEDFGYDPAHWWRTSDGIREVPFEALDYLYARFLFHPPGGMG